MYSFLATMRLRDGGLFVGPKRRTLFAKGVRMDKRAVKDALRPLSGYWSRPSDSDHKPGSPIQADVPVMGFMEFKTKARKLLAEAGLLVSQGSADD